MNVHPRPLSTRISLLGTDMEIRGTTMAWRPLSPYLKIGTPGTRTVSMLRSTNQDSGLRTGVLLVSMEHRAWGRIWLENVHLLRPSVIRASSQRMAQRAHLQFEGLAHITCRNNQELHLKSQWRYLSGPRLQFHVCNTTLPNPASAHTPPAQHTASSPKQQSKPHSIPPQPQRQ
jgi:hypothetical protein